MKEITENKNRRKKTEGMIKDKRGARRGRGGGGWVKEEEEEEERRAGC